MSTGIPHTKSADSTIALLREGYAFATRRFRRLGTDIFRTRLMLKPAFFARGAEASQLFYHPDRFTRQGAMPVPTIKMLQDFGSVQTLSGAEHSRRKQMFMSMMSDEQHRAAALDRRRGMARRRRGAGRARSCCWPRRRACSAAPCAAGPASGSTRPRWRSARASSPPRSPALAMSA